ncbi:MAG: hypothetical protein RBS80_14160 [Thermoguttaceae bacterium]|jgi:thioredoxin-like negative regulator of GroEL|nr:hypothetical protein [Thermoguttaceae bacterium]
MGQCGRKRIGFLAALLLLGLFGADAVAQPGAPAEGPRTAALHKTIREENHAEARKLAEAMLKSASQGERAAAAVAYGRVLLSLGEKEPARQYLGFMANQKLEGDAAEVMKVYAAWLAALDGNFDEAVKTLEPMLTGEPHGPAPVEAADVLAQLHLARGDRPAAGKAIDYGLRCLKYQDLKHPYLERLLRNRLAVDPDEAYPEVVVG